MLHLHRAERTDTLADALAEVLRVPPDDAFAGEVVAVPARGVERWLAQRLSHVLGAGDGGGDGVCAGLEFPSPAGLVADAVEAGSGIAAGGDPWRPERLVWSVLAAVDECAPEPWCATLGRWVGAQPGADPDGADRRRGRRLAAADLVTRLFASYGAQRPAVLRDWAAGRDTDGAGAALDAAHDWQPRLWRALRGRVGVPSPAERLEQACAALAADPALSALPGRLSVFGPTRLSADQLAVLGALATAREVHVWLPHPSPALWERLRGAGAAAALPRRREDPSALAARNPLLASLGRDARELQLVLAAGAPGASDTHHAGAGPAPGGPAAPPPTLLARVQAAVAADTPPGGGPLPVLAPGDRSLQVHACHGRSRQVEVLREVVLGLLADDATLEPRDVLVMCPDVEVFAPLVAAAFGLDPVAPGGSADPRGEDGAGGPRDGHPGHRLRVRLADRSLRRTNPVLGVAAALLDLASSRVDAVDVLALAATPPVRRRFGLGDDDLERLRDWVGESGVRWGFDARHRVERGSAASLQNTWRAGLDRVLLGVAMTGEDDRVLGLATGLEDVDGSDIALAGTLAELLDRLQAAVGALSGVHPPAHWAAVLLDALDALTLADGTQAWQASQARALVLEALPAVPDAGDAPPPLRLADVRGLLAGRLAGRPTRANFRTGDLTVCSLVPMRSVPHRVVCLLGLDDGATATGAAVDGDDVLALDPVVGERDPRSETRQMVLDAAMSARDHLVVVHTGADERTGVVLPPAVPVGELLDAAEQLVRLEGTGRVRDRLVVRHPLQPFDARTVTPGALAGPLPFSFDPLAAAGARAASRPPVARPAFLAHRLPPADDATVTVASLVSFLEHPVRAFLRDRLGVDAGAADDELPTGLAVELSGLDSWGVGDRLLRARLAGVPVERSRQAEWRRGVLPPGALGAHALDQVSVEVEALAAAAARTTAGLAPAVPLDVSLVLPGGREFAGTLPVHPVEGGGVLHRVVYSRLAAKHRLRSWVQGLAAAASAPGPWRSVTTGRAGSHRGTPGAESSVLALPAAADAARLLAGLVELRDAGLREPLPLPARTACAYASSRAAGDDAEVALDRARREWTRTDRQRRPCGEAAEPEHVLVHGGLVPLERLLGVPDAGQDDGHGERHRFGALARRLWQPFLDAETRERP